MSDHLEGQTPLDPNEIEGLIPSHITTRAELDRWEQENIHEAVIWALKSGSNKILNEPFIKLLHKKMFGHVWKWAGAFRQSDKNIGVPWHRIAIDLKQLCDDAEYWIEKRPFPDDEIAVCFHHRLVSIHPFANGNGRHARLLTDILLTNVLGIKAFSWGAADIQNSGQDRKNYLQALRAADQGDYEPLLRFVRS